MKRSSFIILLLLLVVLAAAYFLQDPDEVEDTTYAVPSAQYSLDPQRIVRIDISRAQGFVRLERVRGEWKLTEPVFAPADLEKVRLLQEGIAAFRLTGLVSSNPDRQQIFEVDDQGTNVAFVNDDGKSIALIVGKSAPTPGAAFVRTPLSDTVYLAQGLTRSLLNWELRDWRQRAVYSVPDDSLTAFDLRSGSREFFLRREGEEWFSRTGRIPRETINPVLVALSRVHAEAFVDTPMMIKTRPKYEIEISGSRPLKMELYALSPPDTNFLLKTSASPSVVLVRPLLAKELNVLVERLTPRQEPRIVEESPPPTPQRPPQTVPPRQVVPQPGTPAQQAPATGRQRRAARRATQQQPAQRPADDEGDLTVHTVTRGESINTIAKKYDVTVDQIRRWNGLQNDVVVTGMEIYVFVKRR